jgi:hypothetical protein
MVQGHPASRRALRGPPPQGGIGTVDPSPVQIARGQRATTRAQGAASLRHAEGWT